MKQYIKSLTHFILPEKIFLRILSVRSRNFQKKFLIRNGLIEATNNFIKLHGNKVLHGPFKGMEYPIDSITSRHGIPKLLGSYEQELHFTLETIITESNSYENIVDIGCAEGYYVVGLAIRTKKNVIAFDTEPREIKFCKEMARLNKVESKITTKDWCNSDFLKTLNENRCFILCDCEGYEAKLFDSDTISYLTKCDLLIELHNTDKINMAKLISKRFKNTHHIEIISSEPRNHSLYPELKFLGDNASEYVSEYRNSDQKWVFLKSKLEKH